MNVRGFTKVRLKNISIKNTQLVSEFLGGNINAKINKFSTEQQNMGALIHHGKRKRASFTELAVFGVSPRSE